MKPYAEFLSVCCLVNFWANAVSYPGKAPWKDAKNVFTDGEPVPGLPHPEYSYGFQIPVLLITPVDRAVMAFAQAYVVQKMVNASNTSGMYVFTRLASGDGDDGWIDIVARRSLGSVGEQAVTVERDPWRPGPLQLVFRNSSLHAKDFHSCQQPAPVVDHVTNAIFLLSSLDNWHMRLQTSTDDGRTFSRPRDLDRTLRRPGWGLVFAGLPGGIQLKAPNPYAGRLILCSSAYWSGGEISPSGKILKTGDVLSRYSYTIISDDHGAQIEKGFWIAF